MTFVDSETSKVLTPRLFKNPFLELLTKVHWSVPLFFYLPIIGYLLYCTSFESLYILFFIPFGFLLWTLVEYTLHQFVFHFHPTSTVGKRLFWLLHGVHHDFPHDPWRLVMPPIVSLPLAFLFYELFNFALGHEYAPPLMVGFIMGYLTYDMIHFAVHHRHFKVPFLQNLRRHHLRHHFGDSSRGFGVSNLFWDSIFGTGFPKQ